MEILQGIINYILQDLGSVIVLPVIMLLVGLGFRMKFQEAFSAALTLGVAFTGMGIVIGFMIGNIAPAGEALVGNTGIQLTAIDVGWSPSSTIAWGWIYAFLMFPVQIFINIIMLAFNFTNTLNLDLWNVWNKVFTAAIATVITGNAFIGFAVASIQVILELRNADVVQKNIQSKTHIPGVTCTHPMLLDCAILYPIDLILSKIPGFDKKIDAEALKEKIGVFAENHIMGFFTGTIIGLAAGYKPHAAIILGIQTGTALTLFPMVAKLFMQSLAPISDAASEYMRKKFPDREFFVGLDWPFLAGMPEIWVTSIILVPVILLCSLLPGNQVLPVAGVINIGLSVSLFVITGGNLLRMIVIGIIATPMYLYVATNIAPQFTQLARINAPEVLTNLGANQLVTWGTVESPILRWGLTHLGTVLNGKVLGLIVFAGWFVLFIFYQKGMKKRDLLLER